MARVYKKRTRRTDMVQPLSAGQCNFEVILNPAMEVERQTQEKAIEAQARLKEAGLATGGTPQTGE